MPPDSQDCLFAHVKIRAADMGCFFSDPIFSMPDPGLTRSRICVKELKYFQPKKLTPSSQKLDPGCSSRIPDPVSRIFSIPDLVSGPWSRGRKSNRSRIRIRNTDFNLANWRHCSPYTSRGRHELAAVPQRDDIPERSGPVCAHRAAGVGALRAGGRRPGHARQEHAGQ